MIERHDAVQRSYIIPGQTWPAELCWLYDTFKTSSSHAEIGVFAGRSLFASCGGMKDAEVYAIDFTTPLTGPAGAPSKSWLASVREVTFSAIRSETDVKSLEFLPDDSLTAARKLFARNVSFETVFIDALHSFESVTADINEWLPLVRHGGIISGHDYSTAFPGVMDAVNACFGNDFDVINGTRIWVKHL